MMNIKLDIKIKFIDMLDYKYLNLIQSEKKCQ